MTEIRAFRGLSYAPTYLAPKVLAPPFDVIDQAARDRLLAASPYNVVRIDKGPEGHDEGWYAEAAEIKARWLADRVLTQSLEPALYGYRQEFSVGNQVRSRVGLIAAVRLMPWGQGIHPHERTRTGDRRDRLLHMRAVQAQMSPVFGIYSDPEGTTELLLTQPAGGALLTGSIDGVFHTFWRIGDPAMIAEARSLFRGRDIVIADGHHRYETALAYQAERRAAEGESRAIRPYDYVMMYLARAEAPGLTILPTHRIIVGAQELDQEAFLHGLHAHFELRPLWDRLGWAEIVAEASRGSVAFGLALPDMGAYVLRLRDPSRLSAIAPDAPPEAQRLDVTALETQILEPLLGISAASLAAGERVSYTIDADAAMQAVATRQAQAAFLLNPTTVEQVWQVASRGLTMPQKSTYFYPKPLTGLIFHPLIG